MFKLIYFSFVLFSALVVTISGQHFIDEDGNDIEKDNNNDRIILSKLGVGADCMTKLNIGSATCYQKAIDKFERSKLKNEITNSIGNQGKRAELFKQKACCLTYELYDCLETVAKDCSSIDQDTLKRNIEENILRKLQTSTCSNYRYHSDQCNFEAKTNDDKIPHPNPNPLPTIDPNDLAKIKDKVGPDCISKIQSGQGTCNRKVLDKLENSGLKDALTKAVEDGDIQKVKRIDTTGKCCGIWFMLDCEKEMFRGCNRTEEANLLTMVDEGQQASEDGLCSSNLYSNHNRECNVNGASKVSFNFFSSLIIIFTFIYVTKLN